MLAAMGGDGEAIRVYSGEQAGESSILAMVYRAPHPSLTFTVRDWRDNGAGQLKVILANA